jgi:hypothetical protein
MSGFRIEGNTSGNVAEVNSSNELKTALSLIPANIGGVRLFSENDTGSIVGAPVLKSPETSNDSRLRVGIDTLLFDDSFNGTAQNTANWKFMAGTTAMAASQAAGFLSLNSGNVQSANAACSMQTWRTFQIMGTSPLYVEFAGNINALPVANQVFEAGLFFSSASGATPLAPTDGVWFQLTSAGLTGVAVYNGARIESGVLVPLASFPVAQNAKFTITITASECKFWVNDVLVGTLLTPSGNATPFMTDSLPVCVQMRNSGTVTGGTMIPKIGCVTVSMADLHTSKPWAHQIAGMGRTCHQTQNSTAVSSPTVIVGATLTTPNSATSAAAALSNTTAATQFTGLGGMFLVQPTLTAGTDGILCTFQNPAGGINQTPRELYITYVAISGAVQSTLSGGPVVNAYTLCFGSTAASLATVESTSFASGTTKLSRRVALGVQACIAAAVAGTQLNDIIRNFDTPIVVNPGEFIGIACRNHGVVTTAGALALTVTFNGYWA